ncbi:hypothetical protein L1049_026216 [Liquidambar formosana]|uniref:Uncharacterized protein n=1 Tax=Liquidambar formosana TaxID=63359 RepID=A0AAP0NGJ0_LIQFO
MASTPETPTIEETELEQSPSESSASTNVEAIVPSSPELEQIVAPNRAPTEPDGQGGPSSRTGDLKTADDFLDRGIKAFDDRNFAEAGDFFARALAIRVKYFGKSATECATAYIGCGLAQLDFDNDGSIKAVEQDGNQICKDKDPDAGVKQGESSKNLESVYNQLNIARSIVEKQLVESELKVCIFDALREVVSQEENDSKIEAIAYCEKAISTCQTRIKSLMDELDSSSAAAAGSTVSELNHVSSSVPPVDPSILQKKAEIKSLTELSSNFARKLEDMQRSVISYPAPNSSEDPERIPTEATPTSSSGNLERTSSQMRATNHCGVSEFDSPTASTAHIDMTGGVVGGSGAKRHSSTDPASAESTPTKHSLDLLIEKVDGSTP